MNKTFIKVIAIVIVALMYSNQALTQGETLIKICPLDSIGEYFHDNFNYQILYQMPDEWVATVVAIKINKKGVITELKTNDSIPILLKTEMIRLTKIIQVKLNSNEKQIAKKRTALLIPVLIANVYSNQAIISDDASGFERYLINLLASIIISYQKKLIPDVRKNDRKYLKGYLLDPLIIYNDPIVGKYKL